MTDASESEERKAMGRRLRAVREALGLTQEGITDDLGITITGWSAWESGRNAVNVVLLSRVARRYGFTTDYITSGDLSGVRKDLADKLMGLLAPPIPRGRGRPRVSR